MLNKPNEQWEISFKRCVKYQRLSGSHTKESHKNIKPKAIVYAQRTWFRPL